MEIYLNFSTDFTTRNIQKIVGVIKKMIRLIIFYLILVFTFSELASSFVENRKNDFVLYVFYLQGV